jgi:L-asparaginase
MKVIRSRRQRVCILIALLFVVLARESNASSRPKVRVLSTGGTIAGVQLNDEAPAYRAGTASAEDLIRAVPQAKKLADISVEQICNIGSQKMKNSIWLTLAKRLNEVLKDPDVDGVVITHGTDTMEETAYFLSLVSKSDKPVVMVGSMRPSTAISADGPMNLYNAIALAVNRNAKGRGVLVTLNDEIHYAREVEKSNTTGLNTFVSPNRGRAGLIQAGDAVFFSEPSLKYGLRSEFSVDLLAELPQVEIVYAYSNVGRDTIDYLVNKGVRGIVLAGAGEGNATDEALAGLQDAAKRGVAIVRSSRVGSGIVRRNIEVNDDRMGFIASGELNPQKARVLLMLGLTMTTDPNKLQNYYYEY